MKNGNLISPIQNELMRRFSKLTLLPGSDTVNDDASGLIDLTLEAGLLSRNYLN
ncbi:MAG: hypothetical protein AB2L24_19205 [Mangrovibacterium sp.]|jgi:hypothetical protein